MAHDTSRSFDKRETRRLFEEKDRIAEIFKMSNNKRRRRSKE